MRSTAAPFARWKFATGSSDAALGAVGRGSARTARAARAGSPRRRPTRRRRAGRARAPARRAAARVRGRCSAPPSRELALEPRAEAGDRRQRHEPAQLRQVEAQRLDDLFDQRGAEVHAREAGLAVRDRIEDRGVGVLEVERRARARRAAAAARSAMPVVERDLDEHQRLVRHRGMEERVAAAVGVEPVLQVVPRADRVHRLVRDELLEQRGRRVPRDAAQRRAARRRTASRGAP